jgi:hypothetical protein
MLTIAMSGSCSVTPPLGNTLETRVPAARAILSASAVSSQGGIVGHIRQGVSEPGTAEKVRGSQA